MPGDIWVQYGAKPLPGAGGDGSSPQPTPAQPVKPASDPWAKVGAPALSTQAKPAEPPPSGGLFDTSSPGAQALAAERDPNWKPTGNPVLDFMSYPRAKTESPLSAAADAGLSTADAATFGYLAKSIGAQKQVEQANRNLGVIAPLTQGIGYAAGPGKILGPLARGATSVIPGVTEAAAPLLTRVGASAVSGGLEGTAAGAAGASGHDGDIGQGALWGGGTGALFGGLFGGSGPARKAPEVGDPGNGVKPPTGMYASKSQAYSPLDGIYFDRGQAVRAANQGAQVIRNARDPANLGANVGISPEAKTIVNRLTNAPVVTGRNLQEASRDLRNLGDVNSHRLADQFDQVLKGGTPIRGGATGDAWAAKTEGDLWHQRITDLNRLSEEGPQGQPAPTKSAIQQTKEWYEPGTPQRDALDNLQAAQKPGFNWSHVRHIATPLAFEGAAQADAALDPDNKAPWIRPLLHSAAAASMFHVLPALAAPKSASQLNSARFAIGTGQPISDIGNRVGDVLMRLQLGQAAANQSPY